MKLKKFKIKHNLFDIGFADLCDNSLGLTKESLIVFWKFIELSDRINQGNYSFNNISSISDSIAYFNACNAILSYQACYEYFLQIVFFGFGFNEDFQTSEKYKKLIKNDCRLTIETKDVNNPEIRIEKDSKFANDIKNFRDLNEDFNSFYSNFDKKRGNLSNKNFGIAHWANCIKHQGGFITKELYYSHRKHNLSFESSDKKTFSTEVIYVYRPSISEILDRLHFQNDKIVEISNWLYDLFFPKRKIESFKSHPLPKDYIYLTINEV